jgi:hypothetical protein
MSEALFNAILETGKKIAGRTQFYRIFSFKNLEGLEFCDDFRLLEPNPSEVPSKISRQARQKSLHVEVLSIVKHSVV